MTDPQPLMAASAPAFGAHKITVLLVDDQAIVGEMVRRMLAPEPDIVYHYCGDPSKALGMAQTLRPTVILQDLIMPDIDGLTLVKFFRASPATRDVPLIVLSTKEEAVTKAEAFALGANDYLVKLPDKIELVARIRYHSQGYINLLERNEAYRALVASQQALAQELARAADYVRSLLPPPMDGPVVTRWAFVPCSSLGGDSFGYHWLDERRFAIYLLDVCGHGVGAALLSTSVINVLRSQSLPGADFADPAAVLTALNAAFPMEQHNDTYFTMWYGVYDKQTHRLAYANGGHPPALLRIGGAPQTTRLVELGNPGFMIGGMPDAEYQTLDVELEAVNRLYLFSDGVYEICKPDGSIWNYKGFRDLVAGAFAAEGSAVARLLDACRAVGQSESFADDFSLVEVTLP